MVIQFRKDVLNVAIEFADGIVEIVPTKIGAEMAIWTVAGKNSAQTIVFDENAAHRTVIIVERDVAITAWNEQAAGFGHSRKNDALFVGQSLKSRDFNNVSFVGMFQFVLLIGSEVSVVDSGLVTDRRGVVRLRFVRLRVGRKQSPKHRHVVEIILSLRRYQSELLNSSETKYALVVVTRTTSETKGVWFEN